MKLSLMSDLHCEEHKSDYGLSIIEKLDASDIDVLVLAGDIAEAQYLPLVIGAFCEKYPKVVFVPGNHEYYDSNRETVLKIFYDLKRSNDNLYILNNDIAEIDGYRFLGTTLWYSNVSWERRWKFGDFKYIDNFESWVFEENKKSVSFLEENMKENDIVISHHLPTAKSISKEFEGSPSNIFFLCNVEPLIKERKPKLWMHGHTHTHVDTLVDSTRILANPRGYTMRYESLEKTGFKDKLVIEI